MAQVFSCQMRNTRPPAEGSLVGDSPVKFTLFLTLVLFSSATIAFAKDPVEGIWQAPPDAKGQVGHIEITPCGTMLCGTIIKAYQPNGAEVMTPNVGKRLFWNMQVQGGGAYGDGRVYVPAHSREYDARMELRGATLKVKGCVGVVCQGQVWKRVR